MTDDRRSADPPPAILVSDRQDAPLDEAALIALARDTLRGEGIARRSELSLSFVTDDEIAELHERYMDEPGPTDVLSFPLDEDDARRGVRAARRRRDRAGGGGARNNPADPAAELRLLLVHGVLHLLGYDHEEDGERAAMWARQERYSGVRGAVIGDGSLAGRARALRVACSPLAEAALTRMTRVRALALEEEGRRNAAAARRRSSPTRPGT